MAVLYKLEDIDGKLEKVILPMRGYSILHYRREA